ncbi:MAG: cytochrome C biogenesis protein [Candidatus Latescibacterota bacterium]|nr:MAG: cytochrome C biogenesis protein [Candidatus Latescibacterota bacterium]
MRGTIARLGALLAKDLLLELRTRQGLLSMTLFSFLSILLLAFAFEPSREETRFLAPGLLWVAFAFSGTIGLEHTHAIEAELGGMEGLLLAPMDRGLIYLAKLIASTIFMFVSEVLTLPVFTIFFNVDLLPILPSLLLLNLAGTIGFCSVGTLLVAVTARTRLKGVILPVLLFPVIVPVLLAAVEGTAAIFRGEPFGTPLKILVAFDIIFTSVSFLTFGFALEE